MEDRKIALLCALVNEYINNAHAISSGLLAEKYNLNVSTATIRNDLASLEREGYVAQLHTSAGRVPTEKGYLAYLEHSTRNSLPLDPLIKKQLKALLQNQDKSDHEVYVKNIAKAVSAITNEAIFVAFSKRNTYYTGISNLFSKPEFENHAMVRDVSRAIDGLDVVLGMLYENVKKDTYIALGSASPFGSFTSCMVIRYTVNGQAGILGILSPLRTQYLAHLSLLNELRTIL